MGFGDLMGLVVATGGFIAMLAILASLYKRRLAFQERKLEIVAGQTAERAAQYAAHTGELEERLRVLESIVTDRGYDVATRIEALRDQLPTVRA